MKKHSPLFSKKPLLIFALGTVLLASSLTLFAQTTTGSSLIFEMKAAIHNFTLASDLNPGENGLQSSPVKGKKTGDMLTAGEYNRLLELVGQGGGVGGQGDVILAHGSKNTPAGTGTVTVTDTVTLTRRGLLVISGYAGRSYTAGTSANAGVVATLFVDNVSCALDTSFEAFSSNINFWL